MVRWPSSLRARLTLWYSIFLGVPLIVFALACYMVFKSSLLRRTDGFMGDALTAFAGELAAERRAALGTADAIRRTAEEVRFRELHVAILDAGGRVVVNSTPADSALSSAVVAAFRGRDSAKPLSVTLPGTHRGYRVVSQPLVLDGARFTLTGTYALNDIESMLSRIRRMFALAIPLLVVFGAAGGYALARRSFAPVASMGEQAARITASSLDQRLPVGGGDELVELARVVNDLLDRLERSFAQQRRFVADASHELRTPTAILRTEADVTLARSERPEEEYRASMAVMQGAARRLSRVVDELFLLARSDAGHLIASRDPLYLEDLVLDAVRAVHAVADQHNVRIEVREIVEAQVRGDADLLGRVLLNLLDNAIKYSPAGGTVGIEMGQRNGHCEIRVIDGGPGIPHEAHEQIFERFVRLDAARSPSGSQATSGAGLGLAIARRIAEMHAGRLELAESRPGRTEFRLVLPADVPG
jgi:two-component system, OmpR family, sensor kinase